MLLIQISVVLTFMLISYAHKTASLARWSVHARRQEARD